MRRHRLTRALAALLLAVSVDAARGYAPARAQDGAAGAAPPVAAPAEPVAGAAEPVAAPDEEAQAAAYRRLSEPPGGVARVFGTIALGTGLRFNNPYRLQTQLGDSAESLSLTSGYLDLGFAAAFGPADGLQHGAAIHLSIGLAGVPQQSIAPSYLLAYRGAGSALVYGRLGAAILTSPDFNVGAELAGGLGYFFTAKLALTGEIVGNLFYGAGTYEAVYTVYPVLSAQLGLMIDHEILP